MRRLSVAFVFLLVLLIVEYTKQMIFLDNDEIAVINLKSGVKVKKLNNVEVTPGSLPTVSLRFAARTGACTGRPSRAAI